VEKTDFNSYGSRRGNHDVMVRGTFANVRVKNLMLPPNPDGSRVEGGYTLLDGEQTTVFEAAMRRIARGVPTIVVRRRGVRHRLVARLGGQGHRAARGEGGGGAQLRAHPPLQPGRHGRAAAAVHRRRRLAGAGPRWEREVHAGRHCRRPGAAADAHAADRARRRLEAVRAPAVPHRHPDRGRVLPPRRHPAASSQPPPQHAPAPRPHLPSARYTRPP
jgi:aconitate hydratase